MQRKASTGSGAEGTAVAAAAAELVVPVHGLAAAFTLDLVRQCIAASQIHIGRCSPAKCCPAFAPQVQKSAQHYTEAARDEITLLSQIRDGDADNSKHCCRLLDSFEHLGPHGLHVCMVFEVLGDNMLALIKAFDYKGVPLPVVRSLTRQMLVALDYLHRSAQQQQQQQQQQQL
jgi:serine/threonine protein kinase